MRTLPPPSLAPNHTQQEVRCLELEEPSGWVSVPMHMEDDGGASSNPNTAAAGQQPCMSAYLIQLAVLSNHQNGRDTHLRQVVVLGPRPDPMRLLGHGTDFTSDEFRLFATLR